jgi:hypothetical protein
MTITRLQTTERLTLCTALRRFPFFYTYILTAVVFGAKQEVMCKASNKADKEILHLAKSFQQRR